MNDKLKKPLISLIIIFVMGVSADVGTKTWAHYVLLSDNFHEHTEDFPTCGNDQEEQVRSRFVYQNSTPIIVVKNLWNFRYVENCASAFNLMGNMPEGFRFPFFLLVSILACVIIPYMYTKTPTDQIYMIYALPFVLTGALGNLIDRMVYRYVIDFVDWFVVIGGKEYHWPTFNVADAAIVIGIGLMIIQLIIGGSSMDSKKADP